MSAKAAMEPANHRQHDHKGYVCIKIKRINYKAHRVIWKTHYGRDPVSELDHRWGVIGDNRVEQLRKDIEGRNQQNAETPKPIRRGIAASSSTQDAKKGSTVRRFATGE
jgi:hypothetical protein